jgi:integrase/recombinase XerC
MAEVWTVKTLTDEFLRCCANRYSTSTMIQLKQRIVKFCRYLEEHGKDFRSMSKEDMEDFLTTVTTSRQIRRRMALAISSLYEFNNSRHPEHVIANPCRDLHVRREKANGLPVVPSVTQVTAALSGAFKNSLWDVRNRAMLELAYGSGLRRSEIVRLNVTDIDLTAMTGRVTGKGGKVRIVPLTHAACEAMREYLRKRKAACGPLFVAHPSGTRLTPFTLNAIFKKTGGIRPHLYRHACATHMLKNGCDIRIIQELLGHQYLTTTQVYTHITTHDLSGIVNRIHPRSPERSAHPLES